MVSSFGSMIVSNYKTYGQTLDFEDSFLSTVGTLGSVMNGVSRLFWGSLLERLGIKKIMLINLSVQIGLSFTLRWVSSSGAVYLIYVITVYFCYGGWYAMMPATITRIFGKKIGTTIYGITFIGFTASSWFAFFAVKNI